MAELAISAAAGTLLSGVTSAGTMATLTGVATTIGILSSLAGTISQVQATNEEAGQAKLQAGQTKVESFARQTAMRRELLLTLGENDANFAGGGTATGQGIALTARKQARDTTQDQLSIERRDSNFRAALYRARAQGLRRRAGTELFTGLLGAVGKGVSGAISIGQLGIPA